MGQKSQPIRSRNAGTGNLPNIECIMLHCGSTSTRKYALRAAPLLQRPVLSMHADWHAPHLCGTGLSIRKVAPNGVRRTCLVHSEICTASTCSVCACRPACSTSLWQRPVHAESVTEWHAPHLACKRKCVPCPM